MFVQLNLILILWRYIDDEQYRIEKVRGRGGERRGEVGGGGGKRK